MFVRASFAVFALVLVAASAVAQTPASQRYEGELTSRAPRASFDLQLEAGQVVTLTTDSTQNLDTVLTLNGPNGRTVAENDDVQQGILSSRIVYVAQSTGRHRAVVSGYGGARGVFELNVTYGLDVGLSSEARTLREERITFDSRRTEVRFPVDLSADDTFVATTYAVTANLDTTLALLDASGATVSQNDDRGDGTLNSQLVFEAAAAGRYQLVVSTFGGNGAGEAIVSLALDPNAQAPFNFDTIERRQIAEYAGTINDSQLTREYPIRLTARQTVLVMSEATSGNLDTVLTLNDPDGYPVAINDDRGDGSFNSAFAYTATAAGTYTLEVSRYAQSNTSGAYRVVISEVAASVVDDLQALVENAITLSGEVHTIETRDFRMHYTLEGRDASTHEYARLTADALQEVFDIQVNRIGWAAPVRDRDGRYRAYIGEAEGNMGYTKPVQIVFDNPNTPNARERSAARAVLMIDNDFRGMGKKAPPESLMRATATHELNHVIQFGYDALEGLNWLYESTASWTETTTVGADQDATDYVETDYAQPERCWTTRSPGFNYAQWTLLQSLSDQYGERIVVQLWENAAEYDGFETMERTLASAGTTIPEALRRWRAQNFARDYDLAPRFTRTVRLGGTISRDGNWTPRERIEQLGASYLALRLTGPRMFTLRGDANMELVGLGRRNGQIEVVPLGRGGVFDPTVYQYAAMMVFNRAMPTAPGSCSGANYSIQVTNAAGAAPAALYQFDARHFSPPS